MTMVVVDDPGGVRVETMFVGKAAEEVGRRLGRVVTPREVTALFYSRAVPEELGPIVGGRPHPPGGAAGAAGGPSRPNRRGGGRARPPRPLTRQVRHGGP